LCFVVCWLWRLVCYFSLCAGAQIKLVMECCFCEFLQLCDGNDLKLLNRGWCTWLLKGINTRQLEKLSTLVFMILLHWILIYYRNKMVVSFDIINVVENYVVVNELKSPYEE
jgi:hypothetical protein